CALPIFRRVVADQADPAEALVRLHPHVPGTRTGIGEAAALAVAGAIRAAVIGAVGGLAAAPDVQVRVTGAAGDLERQVAGAGWHLQRVHHVAAAGGRQAGHRHALREGVVPRVARVARIPATAAAGSGHCGVGIDDAGPAPAGAAAGQRAGGVLEDLLDLRRAQGAPGRGLHQRHHARHVRGRHGGARHEAVTLGGGGGAAGVDRRCDVAAGRRHVDQAAVVGEARTRALPGGRGHRDNVRAVARVEAADVGVGVAGGHDYGSAAVDGRVDGALVRGRTAAAAAQAHVDDFGRVGVGRHAAHAATRRPDDAVGDVGQVAAAPAEHADRDHLRAKGDTGDAHDDVRDRRDRSGDVGAVPAGAVSAVVVAGVGWVGVAAVAVAGYAGITDEVVAGEDVG